MEKNRLNWVCVFRTAMQVTWVSRVFFFSFFIVLGDCVKVLFNIKGLLKHSTIHIQVVDTIGLNRPNIFYNKSLV
jgi:hypothetical protein